MPVEMELFHGVPRKAFQGPIWEGWSGGKISLKKQNQRTAPGFPMPHLCSSSHGQSLALSSSSAEIGPMSRDSAPCQSLDRKKALSSSWLCPEPYVSCPNAGWAQAAARTTWLLWRENVAVLGED